MAAGFIGETKVFGGNFAPRSWALCNGQLLSIAQNTALFSILGTTYGGDGRTTFGLPDCRGRAVIGAGRGPGLTDRRLGQRGGVETHTLNTNEMPLHNHAMSNNAINAAADQRDPGSNNLAQAETDSGDAVNVYSATAANTHVGPTVTANAGAGQGFSIMQPWLAMNWIICLFGTYPSRP